ncbi:MAG: PEP-CTERM sorting domain-containing protein [Planctomycetota bacterium]
MKMFQLSAACAVATLAVTASAGSVQVVGGTTSVVLDTDTLATAASLTLSGVSPDVANSTDLAGGVAFSINATDAPTLPTTFMYDPADFLGTFSGTIEHTGSVFFNDNNVEVGDFTIGFDGTRAVGDASGFFVESTTGIAAILFDIEAPSSLSALGDSLQIGADLLVSPEFASFLQTNSLATADLTGADVGDAFVNATAVPTPSAAAGILLGLGALGLRRKRLA